MPHSRVVRCHDSHAAVLLARGNVVWDRTARRPGRKGTTANMGISGASGQVSDAERRRQRAVESLGLRRQREERFDRITRLARTVFDVDWTSITVLEKDRAWFPSAQ